MTKPTKTLLLLAALAGIGVVAAGCADERQLNSDMHSSDFGQAVREDLAAQIADPDASYKGPPPPSSGERAALAQKRYATDKVTQPASTTTSSIGGSAVGGGGNGGGGTGP